MQQLDNLTQEVQRATAISTSAVTLIQGLAAKIEELKTDPAAIQALADELKGSSDALAAAVEANAFLDEPAT